MDGGVTASNLSSLRAKGGNPHEIYHLAGGASVGLAYQNPLEDFNRTAYTAAELLEWVRQESPATKILVASTAAVYGNSQTQFIKESQLPDPYSVYGYNKLALENLCRSYGFNYGLKVAIARIFSAYGAGLRKQLMWDICTKLSENPSVLKLGGTGEEVRDWIHVDDAVLAMTKIIGIATDKTPAVNVGTGAGTPVGEIGRNFVVAWNAGSASANCRLEFDGKQREGDPFRLVADVSTLNGIGVRPSKQVSVGIQEFVDWYRNLKFQL